MLLFTVLYYLCDVIRIVFYCPFQKLFMKNKCCVTCRIFAWGTIMTVTPLIFVPSVYSLEPCGAGARVCTVAWEVTYHRHPERFCEETNAFFDLCRLHGPAVCRQARIGAEPEQESIRKKHRFCGAAGKTVKFKFYGTGMISVMPVLLHFCCPA